MTIPSAIESTIDLIETASEVRDGESSRVDSCLDSNPTNSHPLSTDTHSLSTDRQSLIHFFVIVSIALVLIVPCLPFVAIGVWVYLTDSSSYCPLDPVIRYPCCEPSLTDIIVTFPLFVGTVFPCIFLGNLLYKRWSDAKFRKDGVHIKGVVSAKRIWSTTSVTDYGERKTKHIELTVKYPAEGTSLESPSCSHIVTKLFERDNRDDKDGFIKHARSTIGSEIEILRMADSNGYDPRKAVLVYSISTNWTFYCKFFSCLSIGIIWNTVWLLVSGACIAFFWAWPLAVSSAHLALGRKGMCCFSGRIFKNSGLDGEIGERYGGAANTNTSESDIDHSPIVV